MTGDAERTKDRRQTCKKPRSGVLGTQKEMHNSLVTSFFFSSFLLLLCCLSLFFKTLLLFYSLKLFFFSFLSLDLHCPMFPLISSITPKVSVLRLAGTKQQLLPTASTAATPHKQLEAHSQPVAASLASATSQEASSVLLQHVFYIQLANKEVEQQF
jgi:hypothetical protein